MAARHRSCADCQKRPAHGRLDYCSKCALKHGWIRCTASDVLFELEAISNSKTRCYKCVVEKKRARRGGSTRSVSTVSGGLPGLGKRK